MVNTILCAKIQKDACHRTAKDVALLAYGEFERRTIKRGAHIGTWLIVMPTHDNGMMLSPGELRERDASTKLQFITGTYINYTIP